MKLVVDILDITSMKDNDGKNVHEFDVKHFHAKALVPSLQGAQFA